MDIILYGNAQLDGVTLNGADTGNIITLKVNGIDICSYEMGSDQLNGDQYVLYVPTDSGTSPSCTYSVAKEGDEAAIFINDQPIEENPIQLHSPGTQRSLSIHAVRNYRVEVPRAQSCVDIEAAELVCDLQEACSNTIAQGDVISQSPEPGLIVDKGSTVTLIVSTGPCPRPVPDVAGMTRVEAEHALLAAGLQVGQVSELCSSSVPVGSIIGTEPQAGTVVDYGAIINMTASTGSCLVAVPDAMSCSDITGVGLVCNVTQQCDNAVPADGKISQSPVAGALVQAGSTVNLVLSTGPCQVTIPNVVTLTEAQALSILHQATLNTTVEYQVSSQPRGIVLAQTPQAGTSVPVGSMVTITVSANNRPIAQDITIATDEDTPTVIPFSDYDSDGDALFVERLTGPSHGAVSQGDEESIIYTPDRDYTGVDELTYRLYDGQLYSDTATVRITVNPVNDPPVANAGDDLANVPIADFELDGSGSTDVDGDAITYHWTIVDEPTAGAASLSDPNAVKPVLSINRYGTFVVELVVYDGTAYSMPDTVVITTSENLAPVSDAGADIAAGTGEQVCLDGSRSSDPNGTPISYRWSIASKPSGSKAELDADNVADPCLTTDLPGEYIIRLIVNDGELDSLPDTVIVSVHEDLPPVADAGQDQTAYTFDQVCLTGENSYDPEGYELTYRWNILSAPVGSTASLDDPTLVIPCLIPDVPGDYVIQLIVNDGLQDSAPETVSIRVSEDLPPVADPGDNRTVYVDDDVCLDGSGSYDPEGLAITYNWAIVARPSGSLAELDFDEISNPCFIPDMPGTYSIRLVVNDGESMSAPATVTITVQEYEPLVGDIDLDGDVDKNDMNIVLSHRNKPASVCPSCDLDHDGKITVLDARILATLCTRPNCACQ